MSVWTHVNASIRFDSIFRNTLPTEEDLGEISTFENPIPTSLPCGSEGSLQYNIIRNNDLNDIRAMVIVFYGDLRNYSDIDEILDYFKKIITHRCVRSGILEIEVEYKLPIIYRYDWENDVWEKIK